MQWSIGWYKQGDLLDGVWTQFGLGLDTRLEVWTSSRRGLDEVDYMSRFYFRRALIIPSQIVITKAVHFTSSLHPQPARGVGALFGFVGG